MFSYFLDDAQKLELLDIARLLQSFETRVLWDGKNEEAVTGDTDLKKLSLDFSESQNMQWEGLKQSYGDPQAGRITYLPGLKSTVSLLSAFSKTQEALPDAQENSAGNLDNHTLITMIGKLPMMQQNNLEKRLAIAEQVLNDEILKRSTIKGQKGVSAEAKIILFEAMRLSLDGGGLTESKKSLLQVVGMKYGIDGETFNELLAQALALHKEVRRSINLVLE